MLASWQPCLSFHLQQIESVIAFATVLNFNNTLKSVNLNRPTLFTRQVSEFILIPLTGLNVKNKLYDFQFEPNKIMMNTKTNRTFIMAGAFQLHANSEVQNSINNKFLLLSIIITMTGNKPCIRKQITEQNGSKSTNHNWHCDLLFFNWEVCLQMIDKSENQTVDWEDFTFYRKAHYNL